MGGGRGFLRKPKWLKSLTKDNSVKVLAGGEHAAGDGRRTEGASEPKRAANYKTAPAALDAPALPLISAPWASLAAPRLDAAPGRPEFQARRPQKPSKQSKPQPAPKGAGDTRKLSALRIQAVYRGYRVRRHVASFKDSAQAYSWRLGHTKKSVSATYPHGAVQLPGAPDIANHTNSERIRQWAGNAPQHPFDALSPEQFGGSVDASPVKHYNDGLERHETKEERRERRRQRALNNPPPPPSDNDDAVSVSSLGSQTQDPRTWISSRSSRRMRRGARKSKSSGGSRMAAVDTGVSNHYHPGGAPRPAMDHHFQVPPTQQLGGSDAAARAQLNPYGGGTPGGAYSMPHHNPFMPPVSQSAAAPAGAPGISQQYRYTHATAGLGAGHGRDAGGSPQWSGYDAAEGSIFSSPPNYGASAAGPVRDIMRDLDELANIRTAATGQWPAASAFPRGGGPGFGGLRMSYPPTLMGRGVSGGGLSSGGYMGPGGASAWAGGMSPIVEHQPTHRPYQIDLDGTNAQVLHNQLYTGVKSSTSGAAADAPGGDDAGSVASSMTAEAEERLSRIEKMLEKLTRAER